MNEFIQEILNIIQSDASITEKRELLSQYHESDIADVVELLSEEEKELLHNILSTEDLSEVISYVEPEDAAELIENLDVEEAADILEAIDADDAVDILEELDEDVAQDILEEMEEDAREDAKLILSYDEDQIGRLMTTNYIAIAQDDSVKSAMKKLIEQSGENDNIKTIFVVTNEDKFYAAIDLIDLIRARSSDDLTEKFQMNYPTIHANAIVTDVYQDIIDYNEDIVPVIDEDGTLIGAITAYDLVEVVTEEKNDDYAKFAGLTENEDLDQSFFHSVKKRIPWLSLLLVLGIFTSLSISSFEATIASLTALVCFQPLIIGTSGNAGTQSLAVTIRALTEGEFERKKLWHRIFKELLTGVVDGLIVGLIGAIVSFSFLYITKNPVNPSGNPLYNQLLVSLVVFIALSLSVPASTLFGLLAPLFFKKIHIDPAVASGPLITTLSDMCGVLIYYGLAMTLFKLIMGI